MKKSVTIRMLSLVVALVVLGGAVTVAAITGSPYEILKNALLDAMTYRNVTEDIRLTLCVDGRVLEQDNRFTVNGDDGCLSHDYDDDGALVGYRYQANNISLYPSYKENDIQWYSAQYTPNAYVRHNGSIASLSPEDRNSARVRFMELAADALIGNLKNNITMSAKDGIRVITGTLTEAQVPELAKAALDVATEQSGRHRYSQKDISIDGKEWVYETTRIDRDTKTTTIVTQSVRPLTEEEMQAWVDGTFYNKDFEETFYGTTEHDGVVYILTEEPVESAPVETPVTRADFPGDNPMDIPMESITITYVHGEAEIDAEGNLLSMVVSGAATIADIFGDTREYTVEADVRFSDIGTSKPVCPIPGLEQLLTKDYLESHFGSDKVNVFFTLNEDGSIKMSSLTTTYPGEAEMVKGRVPTAMASTPIPVPGFSVGYASASVEMVEITGPHSTDEPAVTDVTTDTITSDESAAQVNAATPDDSPSAGIIGGADGPTAIYVG